jgi:hypothetical protein
MVAPLAAAPTPGRRVIRLDSEAIPASSLPKYSRLNSSALSGDSYRIGVLERGFDLGRDVNCSAVTRRGVAPREAYSASVIANVRVGLCNGETRRNAATVSGIVSLRGSVGAAVS